MNQDKYIRYLSEGKDPFKEEFNLVAKTLDNYANETNLSDEGRLFAIRNIIDTMLDRPHTSSRIEDNKQLKLEM